MNSFFIKHFFVFKLIVFMAICVYKYVFNKQVGGGVQSWIQVFIIEGRLYWRGIGGRPWSLAGPGQRPRGEGQGLSPPEASGN